MGVDKMSIYDPIHDFLISKQTDQTLTFEEVDNLLNEDDHLPPTAYKNVRWWDNHESHTQARNGWLKAGWKTSDVSIENKKVTFTKDK